MTNALRETGDGNNTIAATTIIQPAINRRNPASFIYSCQTSYPEKPQLSAYLARLKEFAAKASGHRGDHE